MTVVAAASSNDSLSLRYFSHHPLTVPCDQEEARSLQNFDSCHWFREIDRIMLGGPLLLFHSYLSSAADQVDFISYNCIHDPLQIKLTVY